MGFEALLRSGLQGRESPASDAWAESRATAFAPDRRCVAGFPTRAQRTTERCGRDVTAAAASIHFGGLSSRERVELLAALNPLRDPGDRQKASEFAGGMAERS